VTAIKLPVLGAPSDTDLVARGIDLAKSYRRGGLETAALRGVSIDVRAGEVVFVLGPSGSGKSTLLHLVGALDTPTRGQVWLFGEEVSARDDRARAMLRRARLGFVFQSFHLIPALSALENVLVPRVPEGITSDDTRRARALLEQLGLGARIDHRPDELSGGESQRVAIARALVGRPRLVLADEPTGELDSKTGAEVTAALRKAARDEGTAVVIVTHDERLVSKGDRVMRLRDGVVDSPSVPALA
jgi:putative ABC transport system ATP-binding protein